MSTNNPDNSLATERPPEPGDPENLVVLRDAESAMWVGQPAAALSIMQAGTALADCER
jgi:hypothetical protein